MSHKTEQKFRNVLTWWESNKSDGRVRDVKKQLDFYEKAIHMLVDFQIDLLDDIQKLEGRLPGDRDETSRFPIDWESLPKRIIPVAAAFGGDGQKIG